MANHADLPSSEWHPAYPPGTDLATNGDVFVADGAGDGNWIALNTLLEADKAYGQLSSQDETIAIPQATDPTLATDVDYINLTSATMWDADSSKDVTLDATNGTMTFDLAGNYMLGFWINHSIDGVANANLSFKFSVNGVFDTKKLISTSDFSGDIQNSTASGLVISASIGDVVRLHVACDDSRTMTIHSSSVHVVRL